jgi:hypothetical protein
MTATTAAMLQRRLELRQARLGRIVAHGLAAMLEPVPTDQPTVTHDDILTMRQNRRTIEGK